MPEAAGMSTRCWQYNIENCTICLSWQSPYIHVMRKTMNSLAGIATMLAAFTYAPLTIVLVFFLWLGCKRQVVAERRPYRTGGTG